MVIVEYAVAALALLSVLAFLLYLVDLLRSPDHGRPKTPTYNRYGDPLPPSTNPGFQETEDERSPP